MPLILATGYAELPADADAHLPKLPSHFFSTTLCRPSTLRSTADGQRPGYAISPAWLGAEFLVSWIQTAFTGARVAPSEGSQSALLRATSIAAGELVAG